MAQISKLFLYFVAFFVICNFIKFSNGRCTSKPLKLGNQKLMLFLLDGFRWDYLNNFFQDLSELPGFQRLIRQGVKADYLKPDFVSSSYPNYYTLMTGLHEENHGFIHNFMYDAETGEHFVFGENAEQYNSHWWEDAEPLWVTSERLGKPVHMWYWPGCEVEIFGTRPSFCATYQDHNRPSIEEFEFAINESVKAMANRSALVTGIYFEELDYLGHFAGGPDSPYILQYIKLIDDSLVRLFELLERNRLLRTVNIMMFSDHGMTFTPAEKIINLFDYITASDYDIISGDITVRHIWPHADDNGQLYDQLRSVSEAHGHFTVYLKSDIPERWRYANHRRVAPIILVADLGWRLDLGPGIPLPGGMHGYDNRYSDMYGVFFANGPLFKSGYVSKGIRNVELYQLMCHVINVRPREHDGRWANVVDMLRTKRR